VADLSPAADGILRAFADRHELTGPLEDDWVEQCLAAALQALAVRIVGADEVRRDIIDIAAELEGADG
jgi:hypothetical protein